MNDNSNSSDGGKLTQEEVVVHLVDDSDPPPSPTPRRLLGHVALDLFVGISLVPRAWWWMLRHHTLRRGLWRPLALIPGIFALLSIAALVFGDDVFELVVADPGGRVGHAGYVVAEVIVQLGLVVLALGVAVLSVAPLSALAFDRLSRATEAMLGWPLPPSVLGPKELLKAFALQRIPTIFSLVAYAISAAAALWLVLIPVVGPFVVVAVELLLLAIALLRNGLGDAVARRPDLPGYLHVLRCAPLAVVGLGVALVAITFIPFIGILLVSPISVVAGTALVCGVLTRASEAP